MRKASPGRRAEDFYLHAGRLKFGVGVGADFAVEADFFEAWCGPLHGNLRVNFKRADQMIPRGSFRHKCGSGSGERKLHWA